MLRYLQLALRTKTTTAQNRVITHGLGTVPDIVLLQVRSATRQASVVAVGATTFTVGQTGAVSLYTFSALAIVLQGQLYNRGVYRLIPTWFKRLFCRPFIAQRENRELMDALAEFTGKRK